MLACACCVSYGNECIISREDLVRGCCEGGRAIQTHTSSGFLKQPRRHDYNNINGTTAVQQHQRFKLWSLWQPRCLCVVTYVCSVHEIFIHALNHDHIYLFPRTSTVHKILKSKHTSRRTSPYHTAVYQVQYRTPCMRTGNLVQAGFLFSYLRKGAFLSLIHI